MNEVEKGKCTKAVVLDLAKAFDKVPHSLLLRKMEACGFSMAILLWIQQFLKGDRVLIQGSPSGYQRVTSGVPQGSVLGSALFLIIYIIYKRYIRGIFITN